MHHAKYLKSTLKIITKLNIDTKIKKDSKITIKTKFKCIKINKFQLP